MSAADARARMAAAQAAAAQTPILSLIAAPEGTPEGHSAWAVGPLFGPRSIVILPTLSDDAPPRVLERLMARVLATATGTCPLCGEVTGLVGPPIPDPREGATRGAASFYLLPLTVGVRHAGECPAQFDDSDRRWFPVLNPQEEP